MAQVAFTAPTDYAAQQAEIDRRRQMAELLLKQGMEQPQGGMVGQVYVGSHPLQHMAQALKGYFGAQGMKEADAQTRSLAQQQQAAYQSTLAEYMAAKTPNEKIAALLRNPMTAAQGMQMQSKLDEPFSLREGERRYGPGGETAANPKPETFSTTPVRNAQGQTVTIGNQGGVRVLPEQGQVPEQAQIGPNGMVYRPSQLQPGQVFNKADDPFWLSQGGAGVVPNSPAQAFQIAKAQAGGTKVTMPSITLNTEKTYAGNVAEGLAKNDVAAIDAAKSAGPAIERAQRIKAALQSGAITGTGANVRYEIDKALASAGAIDPKNAAATEALASELSGLTLDAIKASGLGGGTGFSNADRDFLEKAKSGKIDMTKENLVRVADLSERAQRRALRAGKEVAQRLKSNPAMGTVGDSLQFDEPPEIQTAVPASAAPYSPADVDAVLRKYGGR